MRWAKYSVLAIALSVAACSDTTGSDGRGQLRVFLSEESNSNLMSSVLASSQGDLTVGQIDSMFVRVTAISALRTSADTSDSSGGWVTIQLADSGGKRINLLKLPTEGQDSISLARGELEAGTYKNIRLQFDSASSVIVLKAAVTVGNHAFTAGTVYPLRVPSGVIKTSASFTISEDSLSNVTLVFDEGASVGTIVATGSGKLQMNPVLKKR